MIKLAISGCCGKMGTRIHRLASMDKSFSVSLLLEQKQHASVGMSFEGIKVTDDIQEIQNCDCLIEFTSPQATLQHLEMCRKFSKAIVIGTTGLNDQQKGTIKKASADIPIVFSPNMSIGVNLLLKLVKDAAEIISKDYKINIVEAHHVHKKDAPSGTAKQLASIIKNVRKKDVNDIKSIREDEIVGDHEVCFESEKDVLKLSHSAKTRDIFAQGALFATKFIVNQKSGLFDMQDVLSGSS